LDNGLDALIALVDRSVYPEDEFPAGQWEYMKFYEENFARATTGFEANPLNSAKAIFRRGDPDGRGKPSRTAYVRQHYGWFGPDNAAPDVPRDDAVISEADLSVYAAALQRNGFFGADSYYMNHAANSAYARTAVNGGKLAMPVLFIAARYDYTCETINSDLAKPQIGLCADLTTRVIDSGHWMAQEKPAEVNAALAQWAELRSDEGATFARSVHLDASAVEPMITYGTTPAMGVPLARPVPEPREIADPDERLAVQKALDYMHIEPGKPLAGHKVDVVFVGSCTNGRLSDLRDAARVMRGHRVDESVRMLVVPGSAEVKRLAEDEGLDEIFRAAGAEWRNPGFVLHVYIFRAQRGKRDHLHIRACLCGQRDRGKLL
jgi:hypothetical protein